MSPSLSRSPRSRRARSSLLAAALGLGIAALWPAGCDTSGLVGGDCREGLTNCDGLCVDLSSDPQNCGVCGNTCADGVQCFAGVCGGGGDAGPDVSVDGGEDADADAGSTGDGSSDGGGDGGDGSSDGGGDGSSDGGDASSDGGGDGSSDGGGDSGDGSSDGGDAGDACVPPFNTPQQCGDCFTSCPPTEPICSPVDGGFACVPLCDPPLVDCSGQCVDLNTDPDNCGFCGNRCISRICSGGMCVGESVGNVVAICHDYRVTFSTSMQNRLLGNAVFLPTGNPVRILAYDEFAANLHKNRVNSRISAEAGLRGRTFTQDFVSVSADVPSELSIGDYDVFLIYDQASAMAGQLATAGTNIAVAADSFARAGGTIVVLDGGQGVGEMHELLTNATLLQIDGQVDGTGGQLFNQAPADAVGINVLSPFLALTNSCTFDTTTPQSGTNVHVITDDATVGAGAPAVIHRVVLP